MDTGTTKMMKLADKNFKNCFYKYAQGIKRNYEDNERRVGGILIKKWTPKNNQIKITELKCNIGN